MAPALNRGHCSFGEVEKKVKSEASEEGISLHAEAGRYFTCFVILNEVKDLWLFLLRHSDSPRLDGRVALAAFSPFLDLSKKLRD
jgi:hypothetical protein